MNEVSVLPASGQSFITPDLWALFAVMLLALAQLSLSSILSLRQLGARYILSARDDRREPVGLSGRVARAYQNLLESLAQFVGALLLVHASSTNGSLAVLGAWLFLIGRLFYVPAYIYGGPGLRPVCWMTGQMGIVIVLSDLFA